MFLFRSGKATWLVLVIGVVIAAIAGIAILEVGVARKATEFRHDAGESLATVQRRFSYELSVVNMVVANFAIHPDTSRRDFDRLVEITLRDAPDITFQALEWIPRISHADRGRYEAGVRAEGFDDFTIRQRSGGDQMVTAAERDEYFPVHFVYPFAANKDAFGFDLGSNPIRLAALQQARDTGKTVVSAEINLVQVAEDVAGVLIFAPIYRAQRVLSTVAQRRENLLGFALGVFRVSGLIAAPRALPKLGMAPIDHGELDLYVFDTSSSLDGELIHVHHSGVGAGTAPKLTRHAALTGLYREISIDVGGRSWSIVARASNSEIDSVWKWNAGGTALGIMIFSLLGAFYLSAVADRSRAVRTLVDKRTAELRDASDRARDNEGRVRAIVDTIVDGILTIDEIGTIESVNPAALKIFGYREDEVVGQNVRLLMPQPYRREHDGYLKRYRDTGEARIIGKGREVLGLRKDGSTFPLDLGVSGMEVNQSRMFTGIVRDITEQKRAETMKNEFVSTVSHELRTPLTSIKGSLGLIRSGVAGDFPENLTSMLDIAYNNSERLVLLINDILDMEKIEAGKMDFRRDNVELSALVRQAVADNLGFAETHDVTFRVVEDVPEAKVIADSGRLMQVMANLLSNAAKFSDPGSEIDISLSQIGEAYRVSVTDRGAGIPDEYKDHIFEKFSQGDSSDTRQKGGTGLGLSICKAIIESHDGTMDFDSTLGHGSTFYFDIPVLSGPVKSAVENDDFQLDPDRRPHVLHVEDDPDVASVLQAISRDYCDIDLVTTLAGAKAMLARGGYDLVILDLILPDGDGEEILPFLRNPDDTAIPAVVFSVKEVDAKIARKFEAVLTKTQTTNEQLLATVKAAVQSARLMQKSDKPA